MSCADVMWLVGLSVASVAVVGAETVSIQGELSRSSAPVDEAITIRTTLYDAETGGSAVFGPVETPDVDVVDGTFAIRLDVDPDVFVGDVFASFDVRGAGEGSFTALEPRQPVHPVVSAAVASMALDGPRHTGISVTDVAMTLDETVIATVDVDVDRPGVVHVSAAGTFASAGLIRSALWVHLCMFTENSYLGGVEFAIELESPDGSVRSAPVASDYLREFTDEVSHHRRPFGVSATFDVVAAGVATARLVARGLADIRPPVECDETTRQHGFEYEYGSGAVSAHLATTFFPEGP